jgi:hypothetical protein
MPGYGDQAFIDQKVKDAGVETWPEAWGSWTDKRTGGAGSPRPPEAAAELLPWLANDSLPDDEQRRVLAHAHSCVVCRKELAELEALRDTVTAEAIEAWTPPVDMRRINRRIDAYMEKRRRVPRALETFGDFLSSPWKAAAALQAVVILVLVAALLGQDSDPPQFTTLTDESPLPPGHYLRLVVSTEPGAGDLAELIERFDLTIVDGPSPRGVTTVAFPETTSREQQQAVVRALSEHPMLRYVQPLTVATP